MMTSPDLSPRAPPSPPVFTLPLKPTQKEARSRDRDRPAPPRGAGRGGARRGGAPGMAYAVGSRVWVEDAERAWVAAEVTALEGGAPGASQRVTLLDALGRSRTLEGPSAAALPLQNPDRRGGVEVRGPEPGNPPPPPPGNRPRRPPRRKSSRPKLPEGGLPPGGGRRAPRPPRGPAPLAVRRLRGTAEEEAGSSTPPKSREGRVGDPAGGGDRPKGLAARPPHFGTPRTDAERPVLSGPDPAAEAAEAPSGGGNGGWRGRRPWRRRPQAPPPPPTGYPWGTSARPRSDSRGRPSSCSAPPQFAAAPPPDLT